MGRLLKSRDGKIIVDSEFSLVAQTTPDAPPSGYLKVYPKSDNKLYTKNSSGVETELAGGGTSEVDILSQRDYESGVTGTSGTTGITTGHNTTTPLAGAGSLRISKDGANRSSGYAVIDAFTIKKGHFATVVSLKMLISTSVDYLDEDASFVLYDVTNATKIPFLPEGLLAGDGIYSGQTQTSADGTSYEVRLYIDSANADAYDIDVDNYQIAVKGLTSGTVVTEWKDYTPQNATVSNGSFSVSGAKYRRVGDTIDFVIHLSCTGAGSSGYFIASNGFLPAGLSTDTSKSTAGLWAPIGTWSADDANGATSADQFAGITVLNGSSIYFIYPSNDLADNESPFTWAAGDVFTVQGRVPILGWGAQAILGEDAGLRAVYSKLSLSAAASLAPNGTAVIVPFDQESKGNSGMFSLPDNGIVVPLTGQYDLFAQVNIREFNLLTERYDLRLYKNGALLMIGDVKRAVAGATSNFSITYRAAIISEPLQKGDVIDVRLFGLGNNSVNQLEISQAETATFFTVKKVQSPQQIAAGEKVFARYRTAVTQTINTTLSTIVYTIKETDTHNAYNTTTGEYTVPRSGIARVKGQWTSASVNLSTTQELYVYVYLNGSTKGVAFEKGGGASTSHNVSVYQELQVSKGDIITIRGLSDVSTTLTSSGTTQSNIFSIAID